MSLETKINHIPYTPTHSYTPTHPHDQQVVSISYPTRQWKDNKEYTPTPKKSKQPETYTSTKPKKESYSPKKK